MTQLILKHNDRDEIVQVTQDTFSIGRISANDFVIAAEGVSRHHCEIRKVGDIYTIKDMESRNGTYVNGAQITEQELSPGDEIKLGDALIIFEKKIHSSKNSRQESTSQNDNFFSPTKESHFSTLIFVLVIIIVIGVIALWRLSLPDSPKLAINNLLDTTASFENLKEIAGQLPKGWTVTPKSGARVSITQSEKHTGNQSLLIDGINSQDLYTTCAYEKMLISPNTSAVSFGGWVNSDAFNKSAAGFCLYWFREGEKKPFLESYTDLVVPHDQWQEILITVPVPPPLLTVRSQNYVVQFACIKTGGGSRIYFDDVSIILSDKPILESYFVTNGIKDLKLTGYYNGTWSLLDKNNEPILQNGNLIIKNTSGEGSQSLSAQTVNKGQTFRQMFFPDSNEWMNYEINFSTGTDSLKAVYSIPFQGSSLKINSVYLKYSIPINAIENSFKVKGATVKEISIHESIKETNVFNIELTLGENILVINYSNPLDVSINPNGNELEIKQGIFSKETLANYRNEPILLEVTFTCIPVVRESLETLQSLFEKGKELEAKELFGESIITYRKVIANAEKNSVISVNAQESVNALSEKAKGELEKIKILADESELLGESNILERIEKNCYQIIEIYKNTEYAQEAVRILNKARETSKIGKESSIKNELENLITISKGYFREKRWNLARLFTLRIISLAPESTEAKSAKEMLEDIKEKENTDGPAVRTK